MKGRTIVLALGAAVLVSLGLMIVALRHTGPAARAGEELPAPVPELGTARGPAAPSPSGPRIVPPAPSSPDGGVVRTLLNGGRPSGPVPPGSVIADRGTHDDPAIAAAPRGERKLPEHRVDKAIPYTRAVSQTGVLDAMRVLKPAVADCVPRLAAVTLRATVTNQGGHAQVSNPELLEASREPEAQECVVRSLASLRWDTKDADGSSEITIPLTLR